MLLGSYDIFKDDKHGIYQVRTKSEVMVVEFSGDEEVKIFETIIDIVKEDPNIELGRLNKKLTSSFNSNKVMFVLNELKEYELLHDPDAEKDEDELWKVSGESKDTLKNAKVLILSTGKMKSSLVAKAELAGLGNISTEDIQPDLDEHQLEKAFNDVDFAIVESDLWNPHFLETINKIALKNSKPWLYIRGVNDTAAGVGPIFFGKETGCYACLQSRLKSQMDLLPYFEEYEKFLKMKKDAAKNEEYPVLLYDLIGTIAIIETVKFLTGWSVPEIYGNYLTVDIETYSFRKHAFLKAPVCTTCRPKVDFNLHPWLEPVILATSNGNGKH